MGNLFTITGRLNFGMSLAGRKNFILKFCLYLPKNRKEKKLRQGARKTSFDLLSTCLLVMSFILMWCCALTWVTKILMRAILNARGAAFCPRAPGFPPLL